jgi:hypothetical protein
VLQLRSKTEVITNQMFCAYAIGTSHIKEKVNVFNVKDLAWSICDLNNGIKSWNE